MYRWKRAGEATSRNTIRLAVGLVPVLLACGKDSTAPTAPIPGARLAFLATTRDAKTSLGVVNADGSGLAWLASDTWWYLAFSWSPDGARIAFGGGHDSASIGIYVVNADGTGLLRLTRDPEWANIGVANVAWSPDGSKIAFAGVNGPLEVVDALVA